MHCKAYIFASFTKVYVIAAVVKSEHHQHQLWAVALLLLLLLLLRLGYALYCMQTLIAVRQQL